MTAKSDESSMGDVTVHDQNPPFHPLTDSCPKALQESNSLPTRCTSIVDLFTISMISVHTTIIVVDN